MSEPISEGLYKRCPRDFAVALVEENYTSADALVLACMKWMTNDSVREMLDRNEWSPRFLGMCEGDEEE
jgi:hypothetical protein